MPWKQGMPRRDASSENALGRRDKAIRSCEVRVRQGEGMLRQWASAPENRERRLPLAIDLVSNLSASDTVYRKSWYGTGRLHHLSRATPIRHRRDVVRSDELLMRLQPGWTHANDSLKLRRLYGKSPMSTLQRSDRVDRTDIDGTDGRSQIFREKELTHVTADWDKFRIWAWCLPPRRPSFVVKHGMPETQNFWGYFDAWSCHASSNSGDRISVKVGRTLIQKEAIVRGPTTPRSGKIPLLPLSLAVVRWNGKYFANTFMSSGRCKVNVPNSAHVVCCL